MNAIPSTLSLFEAHPHLVRHKPQLHSTRLSQWSLLLFLFLLPLTVLLCDHKDNSRNGVQSTNQFAVTLGAPGHAHPAPVAPQNMNTSPQMLRVNGGSIGSACGMSGVSTASDESEQARPKTRGKGKRNLSPTNGRRKADEPPVKAPANKKSKTNGSATNDNMDFSDEGSKMKLQEGGSMSKRTDEEKRENFLERNRVAAHKCRQRKKRLLTNLQTKVELFNTENDALTARITHLREETVNLKTLLFAHKDCPVTHQQGLHGASIKSPRLKARRDQPLSDSQLLDGPIDPLLAQLGGQ
ncbi:hypothetical protein BGZ63DRAFT_418176 [Mariannaea sp. PMI_226]|nr:hypothetical protein BGZ63DRAFT_418176 [Mariannaea sp. PMI_226]